MLHCAACGRRLTGDTGYYRHREPCAAFVGRRGPSTAAAASPPGTRTAASCTSRSSRGSSAEASLGAGAIAGVVGEVGRAAPAPDRSAPDRIARERERALARYLRDRDAAALERTMAGLDREQAAAEHPQARRGRSRPTSRSATSAELPETWRRAEGGAGRRLLASALFDRIEVLGIREATVHLSAHAVRHGLAAALPAELGILVNGRGERI